MILCEECGLDVLDRAPGESIYLGWLMEPDETVHHYSCLQELQHAIEREDEHERLDAIDRFIEEWRT